MIITKIMVETLLNQNNNDLLPTRLKHLALTNSFDVENVSHMHLLYNYITEYNKDIFYGTYRNDIRESIIDQFIYLLLKKDDVWLSKYTRDTTPLTVEMIEDYLNLDWAYVPLHILDADIDINNPSYIYDLLCFVAINLEIDENELNARMYIVTYKKYLRIYQKGMKLFSVVYDKYITGDLLKKTLSLDYECVLEESLEFIFDYNYLRDILYTVDYHININFEYLLRRFLADDMVKLFDKDSRYKDEFMKLDISTNRTNLLISYLEVMKRIKIDSITVKPIMIND